MQLVIANKEYKEIEIAQKKTYLSVPFDEKNQAKKLGAKWDYEDKYWYAPAKTNLVPLKKWLLTEQIQKNPIKESLSPEQEFAIKLRELGLDVQGEAVMDGNIQRVPLIGKKGKDGAYCGYTDGIPAGWAKNYAIGDIIKFVAIGHMTNEDNRNHKTEQAQKLQARVDERIRLQNEVAEKIKFIYEKAKEIGTEGHPYLDKKGILPIDVKINETNQLLVVMRNVNNEIRGLQYINEDGSKYYEKGMEKKGNFTLLNPNVDNTQIYICEGYATGASIVEATNNTVAVAFDSNNLESVAQNIQAKYPKMKLIICADNDHAHTKIFEGKEVLYNVGIEKAESASKAVNADLIFPQFTTEEKALGFTDFNDLHKSQGIESVQIQLGIRREISQAKTMERTR